MGGGGFTGVVNCVGKVVHAIAKPIYQVSGFISDVTRRISRIAMLPVRGIAHVYSALHLEPIAKLFRNAANLPEKTMDLIAKIAAMPMQLVQKGFDQLGKATNIPFGEIFRIANDITVILGAPTMLSNSILTTFSQLSVLPTQITQMITSPIQQIVQIPNMITSCVQNSIYTVQQLPKQICTSVTQSINYIKDIPHAIETNITQSMQVINNFPSHVQKQYQIVQEKMIKFPREIEQQIKKQIVELQKIPLTIQQSFQQSIQNLKELPQQIGKEADRAAMHINNLPQQVEAMSVDTARKLQNLPDFIQNEVGQQCKQFEKLPTQLQSNLKTFVDNISMVPKNIQAQIQESFEQIKKLPYELQEQINDAQKSLQNIPNVIQQQLQVQLQQIQNSSIELNNFICQQSQCKTKLDQIKIDSKVQYFMNKMQQQIEDIPKQIQYQISDAQYNVNLACKKAIIKMQPFEIQQKMKMQVEKIQEVCNIEKLIGTNLLKIQQIAMIPKRFEKKLDQCVNQLLILPQQIETQIDQTCQKLLKMPQQFQIQQQQFIQTLIKMPQQFINKLTEECQNVISLPERICEKIECQIRLFKHLSENTQVEILKAADQLSQLPERISNGIVQHREQLEKIGINLSQTDPSNINELQNQSSSLMNQMNQFQQETQYQISDAFYQFSISCRRVLIKMPKENAFEFQTENMAIREQNYDVASQKLIQQTLECFQFFSEMVITINLKADELDKLFKKNGNQQYDDLLKIIIQLLQNLDDYGRLFAQLIEEINRLGNNEEEIKTRFKELLMQNELDSNCISDYVQRLLQQIIDEIQTYIRTIDNIEQQLTLKQRCQETLEMTKFVGAMRELFSNIIKAMKFQLFENQTMFAFIQNQ